MLTLDATAFVEVIAVTKEDKRAAKRRQQAAKAQLDVLRGTLDLRVTEQTLARVEREIAGEAQMAADVDRSRLRMRGLSTDIDVRALRARLNKMREALTAKKDRARYLEQQTRDEDAHRPTTIVYRLHSEEHHVTYSERQYAQLSAAQQTVPVRITRSNGMSWWWYSDRFWWDDEGLRAREVKTTVLRRDRETARQSDYSKRTLASAAGEMPAPTPGAEQPIPDFVRHAVWRRDGGRCVNCGSEADLELDMILPISKGGSVSTPNLELRCTSCR